jgi:TusA-related sulfurtransferase
MPVVMVQKEVQKTRPASLEVLVDARVAVENISRFARSKGYGIAVEEQGGDYKLTLTK